MDGTKLTEIRLMALELTRPRVILDIVEELLPLIRCLEDNNLLEEAMAAVEKATSADVLESISEKPKNFNLLNMKAAAASNQRSLTDELNAYVAEKTRQREVAIEITIAFTEGNTAKANSLLKGQGSDLYFLVELLCIFWVTNTEVKDGAPPQPGVGKQEFLDRLNRR